jgi:hypothetical protein
MFPSDPGYATCTDCGATVLRALLAAQLHECSPERLAAYQAAKLERQYDDFEDAFVRWLVTPAGRFAQFRARRRIGRAAAT